MLRCFDLSANGDEDGSAEKLPRPTVDVMWSKSPPTTHQVYANYLYGISSASAVVRANKKKAFRAPSALSNHYAWSRCADSRGKRGKGGTLLLLHLDSFRFFPTFCIATEKDADDVLIRSHVTVM